MSDNEPVRLQLCRAKGFDLHAASLGRNGLKAINIARPGHLGNPFIVDRDGDRAECVHLFRMLVTERLLAMSRKASPQSQRKVLAYIDEHRDALRNHNVACWCKPDALCHGDVLLKFFNAPECAEVS